MSRQLSRTRTHDTQTELACNHTGFSYLFLVGPRLQQRPPGDAHWRADDGNRGRQAVAVGSGSHSRAIRGLSLIATWSPPLIGQETTTIWTAVKQLVFLPVWARWRALCWEQGFYILRARSFYIKILGCSSILEVTEHWGFPYSKHFTQ